MDNQDQRKTSPTEHENHGVHECHKCGWPFPNPHPSAKQRRAHKKICGTIVGFKLSDSKEHPDLTVSDDDPVTPPSTKIEKKCMGSGGIGEKSNRSEDEVFSDTVTEFQDSGFSPGSEEPLEGAREMDKNVEQTVEGDGQLLKVDENADTIHPRKYPTGTTQMHNAEVLERETNHSGKTIQSQDIASTCTIDSIVSSPSDTRTEQLAPELGNINDSVCKPAISETLGDAPNEYINPDVSEHGTDSLGKESDLKGIEEYNLKKSLSEVVSNSPETDAKTSDLVEIIEAEELKGYGLGTTMPEHDLSTEGDEVKTVQVESDSVENKDIGGHDGVVEVCDPEGEIIEDAHMVSVAVDLVTVDRPEIMLQDFKDHKEVKSKLPLMLESGDVIRSVEDDTANLEKHPGFSSTGMNALEDKEDGGTKKDKIDEIPVKCEAEISEFNVINSKDLESSVVEADTSEVKFTSGEDLASSEVKVMSCEDLGSSGIGLQPHDFTNDSSQTLLPEYNTKDLNNLIPMVISVDDELNHTTSLNGSEVDDRETDQIEMRDTAAGNESREGLVEEKLPENTKSVPDQTTLLLGRDDNGDPEKGGIDFPNIPSNESTESATEVESGRKTGTTLESEYHSYESELANKVVMNLQETETTHKKRISDSSEGGTSMIDLGNMKVCQDEKSNVVSADTESNHHGADEVLQKCSETPNLKETESLWVDSEFKIRSSEPSQEEGDDNLTKQLPGVFAFDISVDSSSQTDSLEGNWGSVSVLSTQSDAPAAFNNEALQSVRYNLQNSKPASPGHRTVRSDAFDPPSFMTLVESGDGSDPKTADSEIQTPENAIKQESDALKAGWFPSISNVVNESQGRKKNEEVIAKVTNWTTTSGKQKMPLKSLLDEANLEAKQPKSPKMPKQTPNVIENDGTANSIPGPEVSSNSNQGEIGKEWKSPARYQPTENKRDKRKAKGKPNWVQFVCCSSVN